MCSILQTLSIHIRAQNRTEKNCLRNNNYTCSSFGSWEIIMGLQVDICAHCVPDRMSDIAFGDPVHYFIQTAVPTQEGTSINLIIFQ